SQADITVTPTFISFMKPDPTTKTGKKGIAIQDADIAQQFYAVFQKLWRMETENKKLYEIIKDQKTGEIEYKF
ncbi:MAG: hypothetical protein U9Q15_03160, partial [Patescibacteria group bacterium]|nr:hypothetical protein [Patescibacteria group bacterium]